MNCHERKQFLASSKWFEGAPDADLERVAEAASLRQYPANKFLFSLGESNTDIFGLVSGRVRISVASEMGQEFAIVDHEAGCWMNNPCLVNDLGRAAEARALTDSQVLVVPRSAVLKLGEDWPLLYRNLFEEKVVESRGLYEILAGVLFYPLKARVAGRVLILVQEHGNPVADGVLLDIKLSQNDFARLAMGSRQRVNRIFREWDKRGMVSTRNDYLLIRDVDALQNELVPFE